MPVSLAKALEVKLIDTVESDYKAAIARQVGVCAIINYRSDNIAQRVLERVALRAASLVVLLWPSCRTG